MDFIFGESSMTVFIKGTPYQVNKEHPRYVQLKEAVKNKDEETFVKLYAERNTIKAAVERTNNESVEYKDGTVYYHGQPIHNSLSDRVARYAQEGLDFQPLLKFLDNLMQNPSSSSVNEGFDFLQNKSLPITEDGCFLAYKAVSSNYMDKYSGKFDNSPGNVLEMPRNQVDDNRGNECSYGFHVGALDYSGPGGFYYNAGDRTVVVKVNPKDIVSVPKDHSYQKMRVSRYEVLSDYVAPLKGALYTPSGDKISRPMYETQEYYDVYDLEVGDLISFEYTKSTGEVSQRSRWSVVEIDDDELIKCYNEDEDKYRKFHVDGMDKIVIHQNTNLDDDEEDEDW